MARKSSALRASPRRLAEPDVLAAFQRGDLRTAAQRARQILAHNPSSAFAHQVIGIVAYREERFEDAARSLSDSIALRSDEPETHCNLGAALRAQGKTVEAEAAYRAAIALDAAYVPALNNLGNLLRAVGRTGEAVAAYRATVGAQCDHADAWNALGLIAQEQGDLPAAEISFLDAVRAAPGHWDAWNNLGLCRMALSRMDDAQDAFRRAIALQPDNGVSHGNLGALFLRAGKMIVAEQTSRKAMALQPEQPRWISNAATALQAQCRWAEAETLFRQALALEPRYATGHSNLLFCLNYRPDISADEIFREYRAWNAIHGAAPAVPGDWTNDRTTERRLRIGYMSPDFRHHAAAFFIEPLLAAHDRTQVEVTCYAEVANPDTTTAKLRGLADRWRSTVGLSDEAVAEMIRSDGIDILIDLGGHTASSRLLVMTRRPAPVQIAHFLGHGYTSGLSVADAFIGDAALLPQGSEAVFAERQLVRLPRIPLVYAAPATMPDVGPLPALRQGHVTFGYFGRTERLNADVIAAWSQILHRVPGATLILNNANFTEGEMCALFRARFAAHGIAGDRLNLVYTHPQPSTWEAYGEIDIALDPFPHNAGTTTIEALWLGVPVVSLADRPSVGRFGASILGCMGLADWVAKDVAGYVDRAVRAANDLPALDTLRAGMRACFEASPLRDANGLTTALENAYRGVWRQWCASQAPESTGLLQLFAAGDDATTRARAEQTLATGENAEAHEVLGLVAYRSGAAAAAVPHLREAVRLVPLARTFSNLGAALRATGDLTAAEQAYRDAVQRDPALWDAYSNLTNLLLSANRMGDAEAILRDAVRFCASSAVALVRAGDVFRGCAKPGDAVDVYRAALALTDDAGLRFKLAIALVEAGDLSAAVVEAQALVAMQPDCLDGWTALSDFFRRAGRMDDAEQAARKALVIDPKACAAANNLGNALVAQHRLAEAEDAFALAIAIDSQRVEAYSNRALSLLKRGHAIAAEADLRTALALRPEMTELNINLASALEEQGRLNEAEDAFRTALAGHSDMSRGHGSLLFCLNYRPDVSAEQVFAEFRAWDARYARPLLPQTLHYENDASPKRRLRVGYVSPDFKKKSAAFFTEPLLAAHDRAAVEIFCYAEVTRPDAMTERFRALADHWRPTVGLSDQQVADLIRSDRIDILVDMGGHTADNRLLALARKPAPVQIAYLVGHGYTSGLSAMDAFLADDQLVPPESDHLFAERVVRLPRIPLAYLPDAAMPAPSPLPALSRGHITFGHFGRTVRINEQVIAAWSQILLQVPGSRLVLNHTPFLEPAMCDLYAARFAAHGIARDRLDLVYTAPQPRTWDAYAGIDIALDPFPHNAGTTTIEALWLGVPVLSLADRASVGRFGASILGSVGLSDWVAADVEGYVAKAVAAAFDIPALAALRDGLRQRFMNSPLYDAPGLARAMEDAYRTLWENWCEDVPSYEDAVAAFQTGDLDRVNAICDARIARDADAGDSLHLRGLVHYRRNAFDIAHSDIAAAIAVNANVAEWHANHAAVLRRLGKLEAAAEAAQNAIALQPGNAEARNNLANAFKEMGRHEEAETQFRAAVALRPGYADAWSNLSGLLSVAGRALEAEDCARRALTCDAGNANSHNHLGTALLLQERLPEAGGAFAQALALKPDFSLAHSNQLFCLNYRTDLSPEQIFAEYRRWDAMHAVPLMPQNPQWPNLRDETRRLRVGYFSPDFRYHAVSFFIEPLLAAHDRGEIELFLYGEVAVPDAVTARFQALADHWRSTVGMSDTAVADLIRSDSIDILVDLAGHTASSRLQVFARRPAPVQVTHPVGHGYTTGLSAIDAVFGDAAMMPPGSEHLFSERVERLGRIPLVYTPPQGLPAPTPLPALANGHITFGCFSRIARINDGVIAAWAKILSAIPNARLVLNSKPFREEGTRASFAARFAAHGIAEHRLDLIYTSPQPKTWDAYGTIDIALDPFPHNAGTTTIEALWLGVPVLSLADRPSVGRFGASILGAVGLGDWVAADIDGYVAKAVAVSRDLDALATLRGGLRDRFEASPLRDAPGLARAIEAAYRRLWTAYCRKGS